MQHKVENELYITGNELEDITGSFDTVYVPDGMLKLYREKYPDYNFTVNRWECWRVSESPYDNIEDEPMPPEPELDLSTCLVWGYTSNTEMVPQFTVISYDQNRSAVTHIKDNMFYVLTDEVLEFLPNIDAVMPQNNCEYITEINFNHLTYDTLRGTTNLCQGMSSLTTINGDNSLYIQSDSCQYMMNMFNGCSSLKNISFYGSDVRNATNLSGMFENCYFLETADLTNLTPTAPTDLSNMFNNCYALADIIMNWLPIRTKYIENTSYMFNGCWYLYSCPLTTIHSEYLSDISNMFSFSSITDANLDYNTSNVTNMDSMFMGCSQLRELNLSSFNTSNVQYMSNMFNDCISLTDIDLSNFTGDQLSQTTNMFCHCINVQSINLCNLNTPCLYNVTEMFKECEQLKYLDLSNFDIQSVNQMDDMFFRCFELTYIKCKQSFKDWCIANYQALSFDNCDETNPNAKPITWDIVD